MILKMANYVLILCLIEFDLSFFYYIRVHFSAVYRVYNNYEKKNTIRSANEKKNERRRKKGAEA